MTCQDNEKDIKKVVDYLFFHELNHYLSCLKPNGCKNHIFNSVARLNRAYHNLHRCLHCGFGNIVSIDGYFCRKCVEEDFGIKLDKKGRYIID